jgi:hypothetical protein
MIGMGEGVVIGSETARRGAERLSARAREKAGGGRWYFAT